VTAWVMGGVVGQVVVVVGKVAGMALGQQVGAVARRVIEAAEARGLRAALAVGAVACLPHIGSVGQGSLWVLWQGHIQPPVPCFLRLSFS
jgi:hypothetical protein